MGAEWARGRQDRAAARQTARLERSGTRQAADLADRAKDRDQARANKQTVWEDRRAAKAERAAARKAKQEARKEAKERKGEEGTESAVEAGRVTLGQALAAEARRRWDKRREAAKDTAKDTEKAGEKKTAAEAVGDTSTTGPKVDLTKDSTGGSAADEAAEPTDGTKTGPEKVDLSKDTTDTAGEPKDTPKKDPGPPSGTSGDTPGPEAPGKAGEAAGGSSEGSPSSPSGGPADDTDEPDHDRFEEMHREERYRQWWTSGRHWFKRWWRDDRYDPPPREKPTGFKESTQTRGVPPNMSWTWVGRENNKPWRPPEPNEDYPDAEIVEPRALPRAPEPHTQRPGTTRPSPQESPVSDRPAARPSGKATRTGQAGLAAQHRTDITFGEYLVEIANIALGVSEVKESAQATANELGKIASALTDMAIDLMGHHNIETQVTNELADMADGARQTKVQTEWTAGECALAAETAQTAATSVARTYSADLNAMDAGGVTYASSAAHHD
ncbi:hypothetical protein [Streptomyces sp. 769]|uniref:hypothetical protein n=1 Tax=Streptomyces sp. 769 TaxID=1262452 RepID=UPI0006910AB8|nr:hypothetical protein [Streptomyces sp. 769]